MNKAFIFDMDGVLVDSENAWHKYEYDFLDKLLGKQISNKMGSTTGISVNTVYDKAKNLGFLMPREEFQEIYNRTAFRMYELSKITAGVDVLGAFLLRNNFKLGLVSSSASSWIKKVLPRLSFGNKLESIVSLNERLDLKPKPNPDGYVETMRSLGSSPKTTIILEDSNSGITAAKASGAFVIAFSENLVKGYRQIEADMKAGNMYEVIEIVKKKLVQML